MHHFANSAGYGALNSVATVPVADVPQVDTLAGCLDRMRANRGALWDLHARLEGTVDRLAGVVPKQAGTASVGNTEPACMLDALRQVLGDVQVTIARLNQQVDRLDNAL